MTLFTCSAGREAVMPPSAGEEEKASGELPGGEGRAIESGRWLARSQSGYDDGLYRMGEPSSVEAENAVGAASVPRCKAM